MTRRTLADLAREHWWVKLAVWALLGGMIALVPAISIGVLLGIFTGTSVFGVFRVILGLGIVGGVWWGYRQERNNLAR